MLNDDDIVVLDDSELLKIEIEVLRKIGTPDAFELIRKKQKELGITLD